MVMNGQEKIYFYVFISFFVFQLKQPCTSLSMSPTGDFLATTHVGELGVFLWANRLLYEKIYLKPIDRNKIEVPKIGKSI